MSLGGLTSEEVKKRIERFGLNEVEDNSLRTTLANLLHIFSDPMGLMLLSLGVVYSALGKQTDSIILFAAFVPIVGIDVLLELQSRKALRLLKQSLKTTCHVIRDGKTQTISVKHLVPGDLLVLEEGQLIPADGKLVEASHLSIDESSVTGESIPIEKSVYSEILSGTTVLIGTGIAQIDKTGLQSQIGSIAKVLKEFESTPSPLLRNVRKAVKIVFLITSAISAIVFFIEIAKGHDIGTSLISALTLAMAAAPEEFPLVFTLYLSLAAYRLSKKGILVKSLPAVEGLGRVDIICTDKTGTLTEGKFRLDEFLSLNGSLNEDDYLALIFSCEINAVDAMEASIFEWIGSQKGPDFIKEVHTQWTLQHDYPFDPVDKYMSHAWINKASGEQIIAIKGAVEGVLKRCDNSTNLKRHYDQAKESAASGKRLLGLAFKRGKFNGDRQHDEQSPEFVGILSFTDPIRPSVPKAIKECGDRGIKIKMLTGDHLLTAHAIADRIQLPHNHDQLFSGSDLSGLAEDQRKKAYKNGVIFARLKPEQKLELVQTLKLDGSIVAMTGDGNNDAPALKLADVGISMGDRATDIARSTAHLILMKNDFGGVVSSIVEGQRVLNSLSQSFGYLIGFHIPIILVALFQSFFLDSVILLPIYIVLLELVVHPVSAFVFDEPHFSAHRISKSLIDRRALFWSSLRGIALTVSSIGAFFYFEGTLEERRSLSVLILVAGSSGLLIGEREGFRKAFSNPRLWKTLAAVMAIFTLAAGLAFIAPLSTLFSIAEPTVKSFLLCFLVSLGIGGIANVNEAGEFHF